MQGQNLFLVCMFMPILTCGLLTLNNVEMMQTLAANLRVTCITVIVESVDMIHINEKKELTKHFPTVVTEFEDFEKISKLMKKDHNTCLNFIFTNNVNRQQFIDSLASEYSRISDSYQVNHTVFLVNAQLSY